MKIRTKLTLTLSSITLGVIAVAALFSLITFDNYFQTRIVDDLKVRASEFEFILRSPFAENTGAYERLQRLAHAANVRLTLVDAAGDVVLESELPADKLSQVENHLHRPEVEEALRSGYGLSTRRSTTLNIEMLYLAKQIPKEWKNDSPFKSAAILRLGLPLTHVNMLMQEIRSKIIVTSIIVFAIVLVATMVISLKLAAPIIEIDRVAEMIRSGDLAQRLPVRSRDELGALCATLNTMLDKLNDDITQLKKLERVRSEFLGNVSHELRTPIFSIQGMLETLVQGAIEDSVVRLDFVQRALQNTKRLNALLGDLIEISRIESGDMKLSFRYFDVKEFLDEVVLEILPAARAQSIALSSARAPSNTFVYGDKERLRQVMNNLIDNALKYNSANGSVVVSATLLHDEIRIDVEDTGTGIGAEHLPRIFERFYRIDRERSRAAGGTGLGLAIVKHIIEAHGSSVDARSEPGKGSRFSFTLKVAHETQKYKENQPA